METKTIAKEQRDEIMVRESKIQEYLKANKKNWLVPGELAEAGLNNVTNEERGEVELYDFVHNPPEKYFVYINQEKRTAGTFPGNVLGSVVFGKEYYSCFGDKRQSVWIHAINGKTYAGTYYKSAGDYALVKALKQGSR